MFTEPHTTTLIVPESFEPAPVSGEEKTIIDMPVTFPVSERKSISPPVSVTRHVSYGHVPDVSVLRHPRLLDIAVVFGVVCVFAVGVMLGLYLPVL